MRDVDWLIAPDSFKGTLAAREVAFAIAAGATRADEDAALDLCPVADGGEGTLDTLLEALGGHTVEQRVSDPLGRPITAALGWIDDGALALVEVAGASGYGLVTHVEQDAEAASTFGTGMPRDPRGMPMSGAAGGLAGGLWARYDARIVSGAAWVLDAIDFDARLGRAHAVITGEGRLDAQTLEGKAVEEIAIRSARAGVPVHVLAGSITLDEQAAEQLELASMCQASGLVELEGAGRALAARTNPT